MCTYAHIILTRMYTRSNGRGDRTANGFERITKRYKEGVEGFKGDPKFMNYVADVLVNRELRQSTTGQSANNG